MMTAAEREALERDVVVLTVRAWVGTPFVHRQKVRGAGVDCAQLLVACYADTGVVPDVVVPNYAPSWFLHQGDSPLAAVLEGSCRRMFFDTEKSSARPGDILTFRFGRAEAHAAIVTEWPHIVHADGRVSKRVRTDALIPGAPLLARLVGLWRPKQWGDA
jgi:cell wall-associated NlpC family hydrolase